VTDDRNGQESTEEEEADVGLIGGGGPAATIDGGDDAELDEHGENLREADPGER
jgi:hypothetical protein